MSLSSLKAWLRGDGERGLKLMRRNRSFVFFKLVGDFDPELGPVAGAGVALTPLRSIAVDRTIWAYGLPSGSTPNCHGRTRRRERSAG